jgi:hypothetical protein
MTQMTQMGADPTSMGPPEAASAPAEAHARTSTSRNGPSSGFYNLCS